eukprot:c27644_g2_i1 orf=257-439(+)
MMLYTTNEYWQSILIMLMSLIAPVVAAYEYRTCRNAYAEIVGNYNFSSIMQGQHFQLVYG